MILFHRYLGLIRMRSDASVTGKTSEESFQIASPDQLGEVSMTEFFLRLIILFAKFAINNRVLLTIKIN